MVGRPNAYFYEKERLQSFSCWPFAEKASCNIKAMAGAGFYWKGTNKEPDTAACFLCGKVLDGWEESDDPWMEHKKHAPQCAFVKNGKVEDEYTVRELLDLMQTFNKAQQDANKRNFLKLKAKVEQLKEDIRLAGAKKALAK